MSASIIVLNGLMAGIEMNSEIPIHFAELAALKSLIEREREIDAAKLAQLERSNKELREALEETVTQYEMLLVEAYDSTHKKLAGKSPVVRKARAALSAADANKGKENG